MQYRMIIEGLVGQPPNALKVNYFQGIFLFV